MIPSLLLLEATATASQLDKEQINESGSRTTPLLWWGGRQPLLPSAISQTIKYTILIGFMMKCHVREEQYYLCVVLGVQRASAQEISLRFSLTRSVWEQSDHSLSDSSTLKCKSFIENVITGMQTDWLHSHLLQCSPAILNHGRPKTFKRFIKNHCEIQTFSL